MLSKSRKFGLSSRPSLYFLAALISSGTTTVVVTVEAQRIQQGCNDLAPLVCDETARQKELPLKNFAEIERICLELLIDLFPAPAVFEHTSQHLEYLNSVDASDPFCDDIQRAYKHCTFCRQDDYHFVNECKIYASTVQCGGQPTREEILADYSSRFPAEAEIDATCEALETAYNAPGRRRHTYRGLQQESSSVTDSGNISLEGGGSGDQQRQPPHVNGGPQGSEGSHLPPPPHGSGSPPPPGDGPLSGYGPPPGGGPPPHQGGGPPPHQGGPPPGGGPPGVGPFQFGSRPLHIERQPLSIELCERQALVKHLCPGYCEGGCFTEEDPPTCDSNASDTTILTRQPLTTTSRQQGKRPPSRKEPCEQIIFDAFRYADTNAILNTSLHLEYLKSISKDDRNCYQAKQAYSTCFWCNFDENSLCFDEDHPASCVVPEGFDETQFTLEDVEDICQTLYTQFFDMDLPADLYNITKHTGHILLGNTSQDCELARQVYHKCYWCIGSHIQDDNNFDMEKFCTASSACSTSVELPVDFVAPSLQHINITTLPLTDEQCEERELIRTPKALMGCYDDIYLASVACPQKFCPEAISATIRNEDSYLGASTTAQKRAIIWLSRVAALLSLGGACYILYDSMSHPKKRTTDYHQLLIGMAIFDMITAFAWVFATAPIDADNPQSDQVEGAIGTEATCTAQAFFIQLGFTSIFYNVSLAMYYVLVIANGWREQQLRAIRVYMHAVPILLGLGLALGGIPIYEFMIYGCHILPRPEGEWWTVLMFVVVPLSLSILAITVAVIVVYYKVKQRAGASKKWSAGGGVGKMEQAVFWQCLFYAFSFYITWPILFAVYLASIDADGPLGLSLTVAFVAPLQGFSNFLVYIRPDIMRSYRRRRKRSATRNSDWVSSSSSFASATFARIVRPLRQSLSVRTVRQSVSNRQQEGVARIDPSVALARSPRITELVNRQVESGDVSPAEAPVVQANKGEDSASMHSFGEDSASKISRIQQCADDDDQEAEGLNLMELQFAKRKGNQHDDRSRSPVKAADDLLEIDPSKKEPKLADSAFGTHSGIQGNDLDSSKTTSPTEVENGANVSQVHPEVGTDVSQQEAGLIEATSP